MLSSVILFRSAFAQAVFAELWTCSFDRCNLHGFVVIRFIRTGLSESPQQIRTSAEDYFAYDQRVMTILHVFGKVITWRTSKA